MAVYGQGVDLSFIAESDLSAKQWNFVAAGSVAGYVVAASSGSARGAFGVLQNDPTAGQEATVRVFGLTKLSASAAAGSAIVCGDYLVCGSHGKARLQSDVGGSTAAVNAMALESLATGTAIIKAFVMPFGLSAVGTDNSP